MMRLLLQELLVELCPLLELLSMGKLWQYLVVREGYAVEPFIAFLS